jgi:hypothetical protein
VLDRLCGQPSDPQLGMGEVVVLMTTEDLTAWAPVPSR